MVVIICLVFIHGLPIITINITKFSLRNQRRFVSIFNENKVATIAFNETRNIEFEATIALPF